MRVFAHDLFLNLNKNVSKSFLREVALNCRVAAGPTK
jgi:hypothetical protein